MLLPTILVSLLIHALSTLANTRLSVAGEKTGPISGPPPPASLETTAALLGSQKDDPLGQHDGGQDGGDQDAGKKLKSEKERMDPT